MKTKIDNLIKNGCKQIEKSDFSVALKCSNSIVVKSPYIKWSILIPAPDLIKIKDKILSNDSPEPQSIEMGDYIQRGSNGKVHDFNISDEIKINNNHQTLANIDDEKIKKQHKKIENIQKIFSVSTNELNMKKLYDKEIESMKNVYNDYISEDIEEKMNVPVVCDSKNLIYRHFNDLTGEFPVYKIHTHCAIPSIKQNVENVLDKVLQPGYISDRDIKYLNSKLSDNKLFLLNGINLFQKGSNTPYLNFLITNEREMQHSTFIKKIQSLEKKFNSEKKITKLNEDVFTKFLYY